jgi:cellulose synthase/poly-beta-1,6-N-acetylglucosamine synthase-like glycosyltransferase
MSTLLKPSSTASREVPMNRSAWVRPTHRWLSIVFTATVAANFAAMTRGQPPVWVTYSPLPPLALLLFTGLYLFALPYLNRWRTRRRAD